MKKAQQITDLILSILYLLSAAIAYLPAISEPIHFAEWCCITGVVGGVFYLISFVFTTKNKQIPECLHLDVTLVLSLILLATLAIGLNLEGAYWFIHVFGPIFALLRFFLFCDCRKIKKLWLPATGIVFPVGYLLFALCLLKTAGECPFPASLILQWDAPWIPLGITAGLCLLLIGVCFALFYLNRIWWAVKNIRK